MHFLFDLGAPFKIWRRLTSQPPPIQRPLHPFDCIGLGWRPENYKPSAIDYQAYRAARHAFFTLPHACAAILEGSIVWCLAGDDIGINLVFIGPTTDVFEDGQVLHTSSGDLWDDHLSEQELQLISGVFKVSTGKCYINNINLI
jgi:hypothetical protein